MTVPESGPQAVRHALGMKPDAPLRIAYVAGPGDACGTFDYWAQGLHDPRTPVIAYSSMFYSLVAGLDAEALLVIEQDKQPAKPDPRFRFAYSPRRRGRRGLQYWMDELAFARLVSRQIHDYGPDVIVIGTDAPLSLFTRLPKAKRVVLTAHSTFWPMALPPASLREKLRMWWTGRSLKQVDVAVNTSSECARQIVALGGPPDHRNFVEIPQVLGTFFPQQTPDAASVQRLLYVGRIEENKGIFDLLAAFLTVSADHPDLELAFVGTGSADQALQRAVAASGSSRITLHGLKRAQDVHRLLDSSDLLICPTRSDCLEGLALVVIEAAVHGVPTLLSANVPAQNFFPGGCTVFPVDNVDALTGNLRALVEDPAHYRSLRATVALQRLQFLDRSGSWGSQLYRALSVAD